LKCRITQGVTPQALLEEFEEYDLVKLHFPKADGAGKLGQAFLEFDAAAARRRAHCKNEAYVADCQLQLHYSSEAGLAEAVGRGQFSSYEMASYKMKKKILAARVAGPGDSATRPATDMAPPQQQQQQHVHPGFHEAPGMAMPPPGMHPMMPPGMHTGMMPPFGYPPHMHMPGMPPPPPHLSPYGYGPMAMPMGPYDHAMAAAVAAKQMAMPKESYPKPPKNGGWEAPPAPPVPKNAEAKTKAPAKIAAEPKPKAEKPAQAVKVKNKNMNVIPANKSGWLKVHLQDDWPKDKPLFTPEQSKQLEGLESFFSQFKNEHHQVSSRAQVFMRCEVQNTLAIDSNGAKEMSQLLKQH